jgi:hypothetical protein
VNCEGLVGNPVSGQSHSHTGEATLGIGSRQDVAVEERRVCTNNTYMYILYRLASCHH